MEAEEKKTIRYALVDRIRVEEDVVNHCKELLKEHQFQLKEAEERLVKLITAMHAFDKVQQHWEDWRYTKEG